MIESKTGQFSYRTVPNDLLEVREYTLKNGLKLFLSINHNEPRIYTNIAFRAGSKHDPPETTGLAHYMEHMLFKGTDRIGSLNWEKEKALLDRIADLYEQHRIAATEEEASALYREIDRLSSEAARLVAPNEYDKLTSALGAKGTNAYTWVEQTVYVNDIPSNELARWMELESERFKYLALRLFHTELETVYEEYNINQDRDFRKANELMRKELFPRHPYGTQTTLGRPEHLKRPSMVNIQRFFQTYYVANNMAIILAGDFDPDEAVQLAEQYFGHFPPKEKPPFIFDEQPPVKGPIHREVFGKEAPYLMLGWRLGNSHSNDPLLLSLLQHLLYNGRAGLLDSNLNQAQRVLESEAFGWVYEDYCVFGLYGKAREGQNLEDVETLLLHELDRVRRGDFEDWLLEAVLNDMKRGELQASENNQARVEAINTMFILGVDWERYVTRLDWMEQVSKADLSRWVAEHLRDDNFVAVYKQQGEDPSVRKVQKPPITAVELNREAVSDFARSFLARESPRLEPVFADFKSDIHTRDLINGLSLDYVHNPDNTLFRLDYIFEMGATSDRRLALALLYLPYLGTSRYSADRLQQEFFRLGLNFSAHSGERRSYLSISGLDEHLEEGLQLVEHLMAEVQENAEALRNVVADILIKREHNKKNRNFILREAMFNYAKYGPDSPFTYRLSAEELRNLAPEELTSRIHELTSYEHHISYYGPRPIGEVGRLVERHHRLPYSLRPVISPRRFPEKDSRANQLLLVDFPIVQADLLMISRGTPHFNLEEFLMTEWYNNYFGYGLSSIVFQEIRESRALAYSTYAYYQSPPRRDESHYLQAYVGTQPDKLTDALPAMQHLLEHMPVIENQIEHARQSILKRIETERITARHLYWKARKVKDLGFHHDLRRDLYLKMQDSGSQQLTDFHQRYIQGRHYSLLLLGNKDQLDRRFLDSVGQVTELSIEEVFGY